jgi:hypothetical protein
MWLLPAAPGSPQIGGAGAPDSISPATRTAMALLCVLAFALRAFRLDFQSLWYDEAYSLRLAEMPVGQMIPTTAADIHPPLYYLLLKAWLPFAGTSEFALRFPSLVLGVTAVPVVFVLARRLFGGRTALFTALLAAASPFYVHYGQETRMYTLMGLCSLVAALSFLRAVGIRRNSSYPRLRHRLSGWISPWRQRPFARGVGVHGQDRGFRPLARRQRRSGASAGAPARSDPHYTSPGIGAASGTGMYWLVYVIAMVAGLYSHLYSALTFGCLNLALAVWVLWRLKTGRHIDVRSGASLRWLVAQIAVVVLFAPWIGVAVTKYLTYTSPAGGSTLDFVLALTLVVFTTGHAVLPITVFPGQPGYDADVALGLEISAPFLALAVLGAVVGLREQRGRADAAGVSQRLATALTLAMVLLPVLAIVALSVGKRDYNARYLYAASPWFFLLVAAALAWLSRRWRGVLAIVAVAGLGAAWAFVLGNYYFVEKYARDDHRAAVAYLTKQILPGDLVVLDANFDQVFTYYAPGNWTWIRFPDSVPPVPERTLSTLAATAPQYRRVWLLEWGDYFLDPDRIVQAWLDSHAVKFDSKVFQGLVISYGYLMSPPAAATPPSPAHAVRADFADSIALDGSDLLVDERDPSRRLHVTLHMRALRTVDANLSVFLSLIDAAGNEVGHADSLPVNGALPTHVWTPGVTVLNEMDLWTNPGVPPGDYRLRVGVYDQATMRPLPSATGETADLGNVHLAHRMISTRGLDVTADGQPIFGGSIRLLGHHIERDGAGSTITYLWQAERSIGGRLVVFNHLVGADGRIVGQKDGEPGGGAYPTDRWIAGEVIRDVYRVPLPADAPAELRLLVGLYEPGSGARLQYSTGPWPFGRRGDALEVARLIGNAPAR